MMSGMSLRGLGTPDPTGEPQSGVLHNMVLGSCCYDANRPWWMSSFVETSDELSCLRITGNCSAGAIPVTPPPISSCAGTLNADGSCTMAPSVNDPNNTAGGLATNAQDFTSQWNAWIDSVRKGTTSETPDSMNWWLVGGIAVVLVIGLVGGTAAGRHMR